MAKKIVVGILAHVDAGKTTLSEGFLYSAGVVDKLGRVDKRDAFLDTHSLERERGITIFSKQAIIEFANTYITLIDTPGHIDFSPEAERALAVQDYAILVVSAVDGVSAHTKTLWHLLSARHIPTFIFVNKTDIAERSRAQLLSELTNVLSRECVDFSSDTAPEFFESCAASDERLMGEFFDSGELSHDSICRAIARRKIFPCFFGSALKMKGVSELLSAIDKYTVAKSYTENYFGAKVYKIARDKQNKRLTYVKITGGALRPKDVVTYRNPSGEEISEKVEEIRIYSGERYKSVQKAIPGTVCAVLGLTATCAGDGLGVEAPSEPTLSPVLDYKINLPKEANPYETYMKLMVLAEEDPSLALTYDNSAHELRVRLMGEIQLEVLRRIIAERFGLSVEFGEGKILYKETIAEPVFGSGHFEPLRHYAEVHLRIEPVSEGSGIISATECDTDSLSLNWQRLIMSHIEERAHKGVLIGAPLTDVKITLVQGKAHLKHTEGGDFRQATYRAVRQALMKAESVILEPTFDFRLEVPTDSLGRAMTDITNMCGKTSAPEFVGDTAILEGNAPVATMRSYATELRAYTRGEGRITLSVGPYMPCHNSDEIIAERAYDPMLDERHTPNSVFCKGGSGYAVAWDEADALMHIPPLGCKTEARGEEIAAARVAKKLDYRGTAEEDKELMRIFESTYGKIKKRTAPEKRVNSAPEEKAKKPKKLKPKGDEYIIVDAYNFIFAVDEFRKMAECDLARARDVLVRLMCDYSAYRRCRVIIVFDAYKRVSGEGSVEEVGGVTVVYTKQSETADAYIEKTTYEMSDDHTVRVVTSDFEEQLVILGAGGLRVSSAEFYQEMKETALSIREAIEILSMKK